MIWKFTLNGVEIQEPMGMDEFVIMVQRDDEWHGVFIEASVSQLTFHGAAYDIVKSAKISYGIDANVVLVVSIKCEGETAFTPALTGRLNFGSYRESCGDECMISMNIEKDTCAMVFKNRFDQKVNLDSNLAFDKTTLLPVYPGLAFDMNLATQVIPISADANVAIGGDTFTYTHPLSAGGVIVIRPIYEVVRDNSIMTGQLDDPFSDYGDGSIVLVSPQVLLEENILCVPSTWDYEVRMKGRVKITKASSPGTGIRESYLVFNYWDGTSANPGTNIEPVVTISTTMVSGDWYYFDTSYAGSIALPQGVGVYVTVYTVVSGLSQYTYDVEFDTETSFLLYNDKECPPTPCEVYLINESLARVTEALTNSCLTVKSDYYGRIDSEPYASDIDGCGGLRILTNGLKVRQATDKLFFASMQEIMRGLKSIDNIGMGMEANTEVGSGEWLRVEPAEYFYQNVKILEIPFIPKSNSEILESLIFSNIAYGYNNWEIKSVKGIDEFNSYKERRTGISSVNNKLDITTDLIAAGYVIENLRTTTFATSGETDSSYDNDIFTICVERAGYSYIVEQGIITSPANIYSPTTVYNWRIRPLYNLMRWFKSIAQCYVNLSNTTSKLFFTFGKGNYLAEGRITTPDDCDLENKVMAENRDLSKDDFNTVVDYLPIYKPETITFEYPLSLADYILIKANPYGYLDVQCGRGGFEKAFIKSIEYKPVKGSAVFTLLKSWQ